MTQDTITLRFGPHRHTAKSGNIYTLDEHVSDEGIERIDARLAEKGLTTADILSIELGENTVEFDRAPGRSVLPQTHLVSVENRAVRFEGLLLSPERARKIGQSLIDAADEAES